MKKNVVVVILFTLMLIRGQCVCAQFGVSQMSFDRDTTVAVLLENIHKVVNDILSSAEQNGDYTLFKSGTKLKGIIDSWEKANSDLSDRAFKTLDQSQQQLLSTAYVAAEKLNQDEEAQQQALTIITEFSNQAISDASLFHGKPVVLSYAPRIYYPGMEKVVSFTILGANFKKANPRIKLPNGKLAKRVSLSNREVVFSIPLSVFNFDRSKAKLSDLKFGYLSSPKKREWIEIPVLQLPQTLAELTLQIRTEDTVRDIWEGSRQFYWAGHGESKILSQGPHDQGWRIMPSSLQQGRVWGAGGKGCSLASNDERGFAIEVRLDVAHRLKSGESPSQYCEWQWKEYFDRQVIGAQQPINRDITWLRQISVPLPINAASILLRVIMWNGNEFAITSSQTEPFFDVVKSENVLEIKPRIPDDLNGF